MAEKYQALYRKWRPLIFEDVAGQDHVSETLQNSIKNNRIAHAYLFCGTRGTGKTSTAKIFSRAVNCPNATDGNPCNSCDICRGIMDGSILDVYEMDAASNSGIDNIREIREEVIYSPTNTKFKVYIIDEAHMLTTEAFNALLKTLEEPPEHIIFILATTEPQKIPATILSRCQRFDFRRIGVLDIEKRLSKIIKEENINITPDALELISELADGSMRDGLSILDQCIAYSKEQLSYDDIVDIVGIADKRILFPVVDSIAKYDSGDALCKVDNFLNQGKESVNFLEELIAHFRALMLCKSMDNPGGILEKSEQLIEKYTAQAELFSLERIVSSIRLLGDNLLLSKKLSAPKAAVEMSIVQLASKDNSGDISNLYSRIDTLENRLKEMSEKGVTAKKSAPRSSVLNVENKEDLKPKEQHIDQGASWTNWRDALNIIKQESKSLYTYLFNAKALFYGDEVELIITSDLAYEKINTPEGKKYLSGMFSNVQGSEVKVTVSDKNGPKRRDNDSLSVLDIAAKKGLLGDKMTVIED